MTNSDWFKYFFKYFFEQKIVTSQYSFCSLLTSDIKGETYKYKLSFVLVLFKNHTHLSNGKRAQSNQLLFDWYFVIQRIEQCNFFIDLFLMTQTCCGCYIFFIRKSHVMTLQRALCHFWQSLGVHFTFLWCQVKCSIFSCHLETSWTSKL